MVCRGELMDAAWLRHGFSTRHSGATIAYGKGELNLGWTKEDNHAVVARNRESFLKAVTGASTGSLATVQQIHSGLIQVIDADQRALASEDGKALLQGDGMITNVPGVWLGVLTADCASVLVADLEKRVIGGFHAGWRGTLAKIVERGVDTMWSRYGSRPEDLVAAIGPAIGPCCFEVGEDVRSEFQNEFVYAPELFSERTAESKFLMDLPEANRRQLLAAGVRAERISLVGECTACTRVEDGRRKYFSHRAEHGVTGRMMSVIGIVKD